MLSCPRNPTLYQASLYRRRQSHKIKEQTYWANTPGLIEDYTALRLIYITVVIDRLLLTNLYCKLKLVGQG